MTALSRRLVWLLRPTGTNLRDSGVYTNTSMAIIIINMETVLYSLP